MGMGMGMGGLGVGCVGRGVSSVKDTAQRSREKKHTLKIS
jgi:hypothetical protein